MALDIHPEFQVEEVTGKFTRNITTFEENHKSRFVNGVEKIFTTRKMKHDIEHFTEGYMIYYPQGHSIFVAKDDEAQLIQLGVLQDPRLVDLESGEVVPEGFNLTPKEIVERKQRNRPRATGGLDTVMEN